jgi:phosphatidate cytidylyltransferase
MMGKSRRGVRFPNRTNGHLEGRRSSFSDFSEEGSPVKTKSGLDGIAEVGATPPPPPEKPWSSPALTRCVRQKPNPQAEQAAEYEKKRQNFITRTFWTFVMMGGFFAALFMGHIYVILIVTAVQIVSFKEVIAIANVPSRARQLRSTKSLNWYWLATTMYFLYGESVIYYFKHIVLVDKVLLPLATHHRFISFVLYTIGKLVRPRALPSRALGRADVLQASSSSSPPSRPDTTGSSSHSSPGRTWRCT